MNATSPAHPPSQARPRRHVESWCRPADHSRPHHSQPPQSCRNQPHDGTKSLLHGLRLSAAHSGHLRRWPLQHSAVDCSSTALPSLLWPDWGGCGDDGGGGGEECGQNEHCRVESDGGGEGADEEWAAGVAEFAADLGGAHGLAEPFGRGGGGEVRRTPIGVITPVPAPIRTAATSSPAIPGTSAGRRSRRRPARAGGHAGAVADAARVAGPSGPGLDQGGGGGQHRHDGAGDQWAQPARPPTTGRNPTPTGSAAVAAASARVGRRKPRWPSRRARSSTVCRARGSGGTAGHNQRGPAGDRQAPGRPGWRTAGGSRRRLISTPPRIGPRA